MEEDLKEVRSRSKYLLHIPSSENHLQSESETPTGLELSESSTSGSSLVGVMRTLIGNPFL